MKTLYTAVATATGGRQGHGRTEDGKLDIDFSVPNEMGGPGGEGTNPEQLFALAYSACFLGAVDLVAKQRKLNVGDAKTVAHVHIGNGDDGGFQLAVDMHCYLPGVSHQDAESICNEAHNNVCPYSKATRGNIPVNIIVE